MGIDLSCYALATACPVLTQRLVVSMHIWLCAPYGMSGTDIAYGAGIVISAFLFTWYGPTLVLGNIPY
eukprot:3107438-Rhodomonas_salina.1